MTIEGFAASRPVVTLTDSGGPLEFVARRRDRARATARAQGDRRGVRPARGRSRRRAARMGRRATPSSAPRCRAGPTSSPGCSTDAAGASLVARACAARGAGVEVRHGRGPGSQGDVVFAGPLPPAPTGIATYDRAVLDGLERIGFTDRLRMDIVWPVEHAGRRASSPGTTSASSSSATTSSSTSRSTAPRTSRRRLVVLHDLALDDFVRGMKAAGDPLGFMAAREAAPAAATSSPTPTCSATSRCASRGAPTSSGVRAASIVHSEFGKRYLEGFGCRTPVFVVPHPVVEAPGRVRGGRAEGPRAAGERRGRRRFLVVAPGDLNEAKQLGAAGAAARPTSGPTSTGRDRGPAHRGLRHRPRDRGARAWATGSSVHADVSDDDFRGMARRGRRRRRPAVPAPRAR